MEPGKFTALVGSSSEDLAAREDFWITGKVREVAEGRVMDTPVSMS